MALSDNFFVRLTAYYPGEHLALCLFRVPRALVALGRKLSECNEDADDAGPVDGQLSLRDSRSAGPPIQQVARPICVISSTTCSSM